jgi:dienelactone hydrolase
MRPIGFDVIQPDIEGVESLGLEDGYERLRVHTLQGPIDMRLYRAPGARAAALLVGGVGGGFDSPARNLYARLGEELSKEGISVLRVRFRDPTHLAEATHDVLTGVSLLHRDGAQRVGLVGHSFGGAVVIAAAAAAPVVSTVVCLATQSYGTACVPMLAPRPLLLIHGDADEVLPPACSLTVAANAGEPKEVVLLQGAGHVLDEAAAEVRRRTGEWLRHHLASGSA